MTPACVQCGKLANVLCWTRFFCSGGCIEVWSKSNRPGLLIPIPLALPEVQRLSEHEEFDLGSLCPEHKSPSGSSSWREGFRVTHYSCGCTVNVYPGGTIERTEAPAVRAVCGNIADLAVTRHHARNAYEEACADWRTAAENQQYQGRSAALMGSAFAVFEQADRELNERIEQMLIDGKRLSAGASG